MNKFTLTLHDSGWTIVDFMEYWGVCRRTYERYTANPEKHQKLKKMIDAMGARQPTEEAQ